MRAGFIEEVAEVIEALDADDMDALREELVTFCCISFSRHRLRLKWMNLF